MVQIAVRTYERPTQFQAKTLRVLRGAGLTDALTVFVGSDLREYTDLEPDLRYVQVRKGGANAIADICAHYPRDTPIMFLDDDLESFFGGDLAHMIEEGFKRADVWGFGYVSNPLWASTMADWGPRYATLGGSSFGARNRPELITTTVAHCDDIVRTIQYFRAGVIPYVWKKAGFKTRYTKNAGGLQSSGERADTKAVCEELVKTPDVKDWCRGIWQHRLSCGLWEIKLLSPAAVKARLAKSEPTRAGTVG
jgi:hypothetical protein